MLIVVIVNEDGGPKSPNRNVQAKKPEQGIVG